MDSSPQNKKIPTPSELMARLQSLMQSEADINADYSEVLQALVQIEEKQASRQHEILDLKKLLISSLETEAKSNKYFMQNSPSSLLQKKTIKFTTQHLKEEPVTSSPKAASPTLETKPKNVLPLTSHKLLEFPQNEAEKLRSSKSGFIKKSLTLPIDPINPKGLASNNGIQLTSKFSLNAVSPKKTIQKTPLLPFSKVQPLNSDLASGSNCRSPGAKNKQLSNLVKTLALSTQHQTSKPAVPRLFPKQDKQQGSLKTAVNFPKRTSAAPQAQTSVPKEFNISQSVENTPRMALTRTQSRCKKIEENNTKSPSRGGSVSRTKTAVRVLEEPKSANKSSLFRSVLSGRTAPAVPRLFPSASANSEKKTAVLQKSQSMLPCATVGLFHSQPAPSTERQGLDWMNIYDRPDVPERVISVSPKPSQHATAKQIQPVILSVVVEENGSPASKENPPITNTRYTRSENKRASGNSWQSVLLGKDLTKASLETTAASPVHRCMTSESPDVGKMAVNILVTEQPKFDLDMTLKTQRIKLSSKGSKDKHVPILLDTLNTALNSHLNKPICQDFDNLPTYLDIKKQSESLAFGDISQISQEQSDDSRIEASIAGLLDLNICSTTKHNTTEKTEYFNPVKKEVTPPAIDIGGTQTSLTIQPDFGWRMLLASGKPSPSKARQLPAFEIKLGLLSASQTFPGSTSQKGSPTC